MNIHSVPSFSWSGTAVAALLGCAPAAASATDILARVISSTPVVQQVAVPRQVCNNVQVLMQPPTSGAGALMGALAGGAAGNAIGNGGGRAAATMLGLVGGAIVGERIESPGPQTRNVQQCGTQTVYENRTSHYDVVYEYQRTRYNVQLAQDPGLYVRLRVTPADGMAVAPQVILPQAPSQPVYTEPAYVAAPLYSPPVYAAQIYAAPIHAAPMYVQPAPYPAYYPRPYYAPFYAPMGLSLRFGYARGHRHRH